MCQTILLQFTLHFGQDPLNGSCTLHLTLLLPPQVSFTPSVSFLGTFLVSFFQGANTCNLLAPESLPTHLLREWWKLGGVEVEKLVSWWQTGREVAIVLDLRSVTSCNCVFGSLLVTLANPVLSYIKRQILCLPLPNLLVPCKQSMKVICHECQKIWAFTWSASIEQSPDSRSCQQLSPRSQKRNKSSCFWHWLCEGWQEVPPHTCTFAEMHEETSLWVLTK